MPRRLLRLVCLVVLCACAPRGVMTVVPGAVHPRADIQRVFVATNRTLAPDAPVLPFEQDFGEARDETLRFARVDVSIPHSHLPGRIEWPGQATPDPAQHFVTVQEETYDGVTPFLADVSAALPPGTQDVLVFVHGFNVNQAEATYRMAQTAHDYNSEAPVIAFSWPSAGSARGYAYDRDSVIFSRDALEQLLIALTERRGLDVFLAGHSMGSQLVMETLRQLSIAGRGEVLSRLNGVALLSPDIDEDVFLQQAQRILPFPEPFTLFVSHTDRALGLSAFLTGRPSRLGSIEDPTRLADLPIEIVDISGLEGGDLAGHMTALTSPEAIEMILSLR